MASRNKLSRVQRTEEKANYLFLIYKQMGADRSLKKLGEYAGAVGVKISANTLERYSSKFEWQKKLIEQQAADQERNEKDVTAIVTKMNDRQAQLGQALQIVAQASIQPMLDKIKANTSLKLKPFEIAAFVRTGQITERLARGQATSREEIKVEIMNVIINEFAVIFLSVNTIDDPEVRKQEYVRRFNELLQIHFSQAKKENYQIGRG